MRYFLALADELNTVRAARHCGMTPAVLGRHIAELEESLGCSLFRRRGTKVSLTAAGQVFRQRARDLLTSAAAAAGEVRAAAAATASQIRLGHFGEWWARRYAEGLRRFGESRPGVRVRAVRFNPIEAIEALRLGDLDIAFLEAMDVGMRIEFNVRRVEAIPAVVALPRAHPLASRRNLALSALSEDAWAVWDERRFPTRSRSFYAAVGRSGFRPCVAWEAEDEDALLDQVAAGNAVGCLPACFVAVAPPGVVFVPLRPASIEFPVYLAWRKDADHAEQLGMLARNILDAAG